MDFLWSGALKSVVKNGEHQASAEAFGRKKPPTLPCQRRFATFPSDSKWIWIKLIWKKMVRAAWPWLFDSFTLCHYEITGVYGYPRGSHLSSTSKYWNSGGSVVPLWSKMPMMLVCNANMASIVTKCQQKSKVELDWNWDLVAFVLNSILWSITGHFPFFDQPSIKSGFREA